jgi:hypothetical protein
MINRLNAVYE